jgi:hypothetical protein
MYQGLFRIRQHHIECLSYSRVVEDIKHYTTLRPVDLVIQETKLAYRDSRYLALDPYLFGIVHLERHKAYLYGASTR